MGKRLFVYLLSEPDFRWKPESWLFLAIKYQGNSQKLRISTKKYSNQIPMYSGFSPVKENFLTM